MLCVMKSHLSLFALLVALLTGNTLSAQDTLRKFVVEFSTLPSGSVEVPINDQMPQFGRLFSLTGAITFYPNREVPVAVELSGHLGQYGVERESRRYTHEGTPNTEIDFRYNSLLNRVMLGAKFGNATSDKLFRPFASVHAGKAFIQSNLFVDNSDCDECDRIEQRRLHEYNGWVYGAEAGVEIMLFNDFQGRREDWLIYVSGSLLRSFRDIEYLNVKHLMDEAPSGAQAHEAFAGFIDASSQNLEYDKVAAWIFRLK